MFVLHMIVRIRFIYGINIHIYVIQYTKCEPLKITNRNELQQLVKRFNFQGNGTQQNPYVIENLYVVVNELHDGIAFENITDYCIIRHCIVEYEKKPGVVPMMDGISLNNCANFVIEYNIIKNAFGGIYVQKCQNITIKYNYCEGHKDANRNIRINGNNIVVIGNICTDASHGIYIINCTNSFIYNNYCIDNYMYGIYVTLSHHIIISYNVIKRSDKSCVMLHSETNWIILCNNILCHAEQVILYIKNCIRHVIFMNNLLYTFDRTDVEWVKQYKPIILTQWFDNIHVLHVFDIAWIVNGKVDGIEIK